MNFRNDIIELKSLERIDGDVRLYETPEGNRYPSVTTVLDHFKDKSGLREWRNRVGHEEADKIGKVAATRGTNIHSLCESLVLNREIDYDKIMPVNLVLFKQIKSILDANVNNIRISEGRLYSDKLKIAGTVDLLAEYRNKLAVIDFKTSIRDKQKEWIEDYFLQAALYAYMIWERTGVMATDIVIIIAVESSPEAQVFEEKVVNYIDKARHLCKEYQNYLQAYA